MQKDIMLKSGRNIKYIFLLVLFLMTCSCSRHDVILHINKVYILDNVMIINYLIENRSANDFWVCTNMDVDNGVDCNVVLNSIRKLVKIQITNRKIPSGLMLEQAVYAKFIKLLPHQKYVGIIKLPLPIRETNYLENNERGGMNSIKQYSNIKVQISMYHKKVLSFGNECCSNKSNENVTYVNCFWAQKNKSDIIEYNISNIKVPVAVK